jgi:hypothetical protein
MSEFTKDALVEQLSANVCEIVFTKLRGEEREMVCTRMASYLPETVATTLEEAATRKENDNVIAVWDLRVNNGEGGWRSFRIDKLKSINVIENFGVEATEE